MIYFFEKKIITSEIAMVVNKLEKELKKYGFGILSQLSMDRILDEKIGAKLEPYIILQVCNPNYADQVLKIEKSIGLFLPCSIVIRATSISNEFEVLFPNINALMSLVDNEEILQIADEIYGIFQNILETL